MAEQPANAPALPWAAQQAATADVKPVQDTHATVALEDLQPQSIQQLGLEPGARVEVMWEVTTEEGEGSSSKWFAASISCSTSAQDTAGDPASTSGAAGKQLHQQHRCTLKYDGSEEFPEETATVLLLSEHELYDLDKRDTMVWRREGDSFEPPEESDGEEEAEVLEEEGGVASDMELSPEEAAAAEAAMMERLTSLTQSESQKQHLVAGYNDFKNQFKAFIAAKAACAEGGDVLITTSDVEEFKAMMNTQRATAGAHRR